LESTRLKFACGSVSEGKKPLGRPKCGWVDNMNMGLGEMGWGGVGWIGVAEDRDRWMALVNAVMNLWVP
jgi:hypothetical protein